MTNLAPICLFTYNRLEETKQTVDALKNNFLASKSELFIFSDGAKKNTSEEKINNVRKYLKTIDGFKSVIVYESSKNKGLANSIISGVTKIIEQYGKVIVLEDDLVTSPNFLDFMNQALDYYLKQEVIYSISGYTMFLPSLLDIKNDVYSSNRSCSWGWATWKDRWENVDWEVKDYSSFAKNISQQIKFSKCGSDLLLMLRKQKQGKIDSWAVRWCYDQFKKDKLTVYPSISKIKNIGFSEEATNTKSKRFSVELFEDNPKVIFCFKDSIIVNKKLLDEFRYYYSYRRKLYVLLKSVLSSQK